MKILHLLAPAPAGGLERVVHALAIGQQRGGDHVIVVPITDEWSAESAFAAPLMRAGVEIRPLVLPPRAYGAERRALRRLFADERPDVVHSHGYHTDVVAGDVARRAGAATVSTAHGFTRGPWRNRLYEYLDCLALRRFDGVAAVSQPLADELRHAGVPHDRLHVVANAWSSISTPLEREAARVELGVRDDRFVIGWVGRMTHEKGLDVLVDAVALLPDVPVTVCAIGAGPERVGQEARAAAAHIGDRFRWPGLVREAGRYFRAFDLLVLSSRTEGVPMVVLEAMAAGVPIVASAVGGIPHVLSEREALLVPPDRPDAVASAVRSVVNDRAAAASRAAAAQARLASEFSEGPWLRRYADVYRAALQSARRR